MRVAERPLEPGSALLLYEFFEIYVKETGQAPEMQVYQATEFAETEGKVMVKGTCYAQARIVLGHRSLAGGRHTCDDAISSSDADATLREWAPELVRVTNCTAWFSMDSLVSLFPNGKPMVVHPQEIKERGVSVAGKAQHYVCGSQAQERDTGGFVISPLPRGELASLPEEFLGQNWQSVTACWGTVDEMFERARGVLRDGSGVRSGSFEVQWSLNELRFWNQVSDTAIGDWKHSTVTRIERRFDAAFNFQQLSRDVRRSEITYRSKEDFRRLQMVSGIFGLVGVSREAEQGAENISRFQTGTNLRVCTSTESLANAPEDIIPAEYWAARAGHHGTFRMRYDKQAGKRYGTLKVMMVWHELTYKDVDGFEDTYLIVR